MEEDDKEVEADHESRSTRGRRQTELDNIKKNETNNGKEVANAEEEEDKEEVEQKQEELQEEQKQEQQQQEQKQEEHCKNKNKVNN